MWEACRSIAPKLDVGAESLRKWVRQAQADAGQRPGVTADVAEENRRLRAEIRELKRAIELLGAASVFFAAELDGHGSPRDLHRHPPRSVR